MQLFSCVLLFFLIINCFGDLSVDNQYKNEKFLSGFIDYLNNLPNQIYTFEEGYILNAQKTDEAKKYNVETLLLSRPLDNLDISKYQKCFATILDLEDNGISIQNNEHHCEDSDLVSQPNQNENANFEEVVVDETTTAEPIIGHEPVELDNEVQMNTGVTSGEQFIAVPRRKNEGGCMGCSIHVNPQAPGVAELAALGVKHLDIHEQNVKHYLETVIDVERQVQVVNGVRYILTLKVRYNTCASTSEMCIESKICKISILEKSWKKLPDGSKYRDILSNNCTQEWLFGDEGEIITNGDINTEANVIEISPKPTPDYDKIANTGSVDDFLKAVHNIDIKSQPNQEKIFTDKEMKEIEQQIVPHDHVELTTTSIEKPTQSDINVYHINQAEAVNTDIDNSVSFRRSLSEDKKKAIDNLINFFESAGFENNQDKMPRTRSYDHDLKVMALTEKIHKIKKNIQNAEYVYILAQNMVNYLNEMDFEIKTRVLQEVITAEEELENHQHFFYLQARVVIACDKAACGGNKEDMKICNGIIEVTDNNAPQILNAFCYNDKKKKHFTKVENIPLNDPLLLKLTKDALRKIEQESSYSNAMKIEKIIQATIKKSAGTQTKIIISLAYTNCNKTMPFMKRTNCTVIQRMDLSICEVTILERYWLKEKTITYSCTQRPFDERFSIKKQLVKEPTMSQDPKILEMAQEALRQLEIKSNRNNKQKIVEVKSVSTQLVGGLVTQVAFVVGYTDCSNEIEVDPKSCKLLENEALRKCKLEVWDRPWFDDGRQMNVTCDDSLDEPPTVSRKKRFATQLPGGQTSKNPEDSKYKELAQESLRQYLQNKEITEIYEVLKVDKVSVQVVAGTLTTIDFRSSKPMSGPPNNKNKEIHCQSRIWEKPWMNFKEITTICNDLNKEVRPKRSILAKNLIPGGEKNQNPNDIRYRYMAELSLKKFLQDTGTRQHHKIISINTVKTQMVAGHLTKLDFTISPTNCKLDSDLEATSSDCEVLDSSNLIFCHSTIWQRPWLNETEININCNKHPDNIQTQIEQNDLHFMVPETLNDPNNHEYTVGEKKDKSNFRQKRAATGKNVKRNPNKPEYKKFAEESLQKYLRDNNIKTKHQVTSMKQVTTRVVSGIIYKIYFIAEPICMSNKKHNSVKCNYNKTNKLFCNTEIWNRPWKNYKKIDVDCNKENSEEDDNESTKERNILAEAGGERKKRQATPEEDYIDEDTRYYYADRAVQYINENSHTNNLQKLITIHSFHVSTNMGVNMIRMYIEVGYTYCLRHQDEGILQTCEELSGMYHRLCHVRLLPSPDDELVVQSLAVVCDDDKEFKTVTGISITNLIKESIKELEASPNIKNKLIHQGEPYIVPSLDSRTAIKLSFIVRATNCSKFIDIEKNRFSCFIDSSRLPKSCTSHVWMTPNSKKVRKITTNCGKTYQIRSKRSLSSDTKNTTSDEIIIQNLVKESLEKLEMSSIHKYKQRLYQINSFSSKITTGRLTTIVFDVGYTNCLKYEWVDNITDCDFIQHLPKRHCVSNVRERLWLDNGKEITVNCEDGETPLDSNTEYENEGNAMALAQEALKHIEAKYPHPRKQKVVRIFSLEKQEVAGTHFRLKIEVGFTDCPALSVRDDCKLVSNIGLNKFCRINIWLRPWSEHPPLYRVSCDYQDASSKDLYLNIQAERLFTDFVTTYKPDYINNQTEMITRFKIFKDNIKKIHDFNIHERGTATYGVTRFTDMSYEEFSSKFMGLKPNLRVQNHIPMRTAYIPDMVLPIEFDWRQYEAVTEVKNQGSCGSCWAFSVTGNIEGQYKVKTGQLLSLSEQELVDCDKLDEGCNGGLPDNAYRAIEELGGLELEQDYPYEGENDKCVFNKTLSKVQISGAVNISSNETDMAKWLTQNGPISIGINANGMQFYMGGISHPWKILCNPSNLDHGVLIVGYGVKNYPLFHKHLPYWIVKNSWGKSWGEQGYYRVYRGDGTCGVNQMASSSVI